MTVQITGIVLSAFLVAITFMNVEQVQQRVEGLPCEHRDLSKTALSKASGVNRVQINDIEAGCSKGSIDTNKKLTDALVITIDDLV